LRGPSSLLVPVIDSGLTLISLSVTVRSYPETIVVQKEVNTDKSRVGSDIATLPRGYRAKSIGRSNAKISGF
jgi:hypothetical protein